MNCLMCHSSKSFKKFLIKEFSYWRIELHQNQCYLGRCIIILKRHLEDLSEINDEEKNELFNVLRQLKSALNVVFKPDLINYASFGNKIKHLHLHVIPRYQGSIRFANTIFLDKRWGYNPSPYEKDFKVNDEVYKKIVSDLNPYL